MLKGKKTLLAIVVVSLAIGGGMVWLVNEVPSIKLRPDDPKVVASGKNIYATQCASCHGANLEGEADWRERLPNGRLPAPPHDKSGHTWHHPDIQLFKLTKRGPAAVVGGEYESEMPAYAGVLSDDEIIAVLSYIKSTWPPTVQARHDRINERGECTPSRKVTS